MPTTPASSGSRRQNSTASSNPRGAASATTKYEPLGLLTLKPARRNPAAEQVALGGEGGCGIREVVVGQAESEGDRRLERRAVHVGEELLDREDRVDQLGGGDEPADLPAGEAEGLAAARDGDRALARAGQASRSGCARRAHREGQVLVDLVGDDEGVVLVGELDDEFEGLAVEHRAGRVVRGVDQDDAGAVGDGVAQLVEIGSEVGSAQRHGHVDAAGQRDHRGVRVVERLEGDDLVARRRAGRAAWRRSPRWRPAVTRISRSASSSIP